MSAPVVPKPGDAYSPHRLFHAALVPLSILRDSKLSDGAKLCFGVLNYHGGVSGRFPTRKTIAGEMGVSLDTVKRHLAELRQSSYIGIMKVGRVNTYEFLWRENLRECLRQRGAKMPHIEGSQQGANLPPVKNGTGCKSARDRVHSCTGQGANLPHTYKEKEVNEEVLEEETTSTSPVPCDQIESERETWWTPEQFEAARSSLAHHEFKLPTPDNQITSKILSNFRDENDFRSWLSQCALQNARGWGLYEHDARVNWPTMRGAIVPYRTPPATPIASPRAQASHDNVTAILAKIHAKRAARDAQRSQQAAPDQPLCQSCEGFGIRHPDDQPSGIVEWCECQAGRNRQAREPDAVSKQNAAVDKLLRRVVNA